MKALKAGKFLFLGCILASLVFHGGFLLFFFKGPFFLRQKISSFWLKNSHPANLLALENSEEMIEKINRALEDSFKEVVIVNQHNQEKNQALATKESIADPEHISTVSLATNDLDDKLPIEVPSITSDFVPFLFDEFSIFSFENNGATDLFDEEQVKNNESADIAEEFHNLGKATEKREDATIVDDLSLSQSSVETPFTVEKQNKDTSALYTHYEEAVITDDSSTHNEIPQDKMLSSPPSYAHTSPVEHIREEWVNKPISDTTLPEVDHYGISDIANSILWEDEVAVDISFHPDQDGKKYIFSLTVHPDFEIDAEPLQQNFYFIIDRSNSIKKFRFDGYKRAVQRALSALQEGDKFNIFILDKNISRLSEKNLFFSSKTLKQAEAFLDKEEYKPFFSSNDLYESLEKLFPFTNPSDEIHSAILISDGNSILNSAKQKKAIFRWTQKNKGKFNLYTATAGQGNNLVLLDLLSYTTSGKLLHSDTHASFPRKLVKLVKDLHEPIAKEVTIDAVSKDPGNNVSLFPSKVLLPPLYLKRPFSVVGTIDDITDFTIYIQGQNRGRWLNIKKTISFKNAVKGGRSLDKLWAHAQANGCYDKFLKEGKTSHLEEAKKHVAPFKGTICLE